jgi:SAM-dependent methyltransferase
MEIKFGNTASDYARHRAGFPEELFLRLQRHGIGQPGQRVLDLGTGTGALARGFARRGCTVTGLDVSAALVQEAKRLDEAAGVSVTYVIAPAEDTGLPAAGFDVVGAGQCWHWFDRERAAAEARRVLLPGGRLLIAHFDWLPLPGNVVEATEKLIEAHNPAWQFGGGLGVYPAWLGDVAIAGFRDAETFTFDLEVSYSHDAWRGRVRASAGVAASLAPDAVAAFDAELQLVLESRFADDPLAIPHRVFALFCRAP